LNYWRELLASGDSNSGGADVSAKNKIIKLNSISRHKLDNQSCIVLDNQQDSLSHVHSLALVPAMETQKPNGSREISLANGQILLLKPVKVGIFPVWHQMQTQYGYLVLGIVPQGVIVEFGDQGHFPSTDARTLNGAAKVDLKRDHQMARDWIMAHIDWVQTSGIMIYA